jgi:hypothetical protein
MFEEHAKDKISDLSWADLCIAGAVSGFAQEVLPVCDLAVQNDMEPGRWRNRRAIARALAGDTQDAIQDLEAFIDWTYSRKANLSFGGSGLDAVRAERQGWLRALQAGQTPLREMYLSA